jgi:hypothetical protein
VLSPIAAQTHSQLRKSFGASAYETEAFLNDATKNSTHQHRLISLLGRGRVFLGVVGGKADGGYVALSVRGGRVAF